MAKAYCSLTLAAVLCHLVNYNINALVTNYLTESTLRDYSGAFKWESLKDNVYSGGGHGKGHSFHKKFNEKNQQINNRSRSEQNSTASIIISPCKIINTLVDCSGLALGKIEPGWFPNNTEMIYLSYNKLSTLENFTFYHLKHLTTLQIDNNILTRIEPLAFGGLVNLIVLSLDNNNLLLDATSISKDTFTPLQKLEELHMMQNAGNQTNDAFEFLAPLQNLQKLSISCKRDTLYLGKVFRNLTKLKHLELTGDSKYIKDNTFENLNHLGHLVLDSFNDIYNITDDVFEPLQSLKSLKLIHVLWDFSAILNLLKPFQGRNMSEIYLESVAQNLTIINPVQSGKLSHGDMKYLLNICVESVVFRDNEIFYIDPDAFNNTEIWKDCLQSLVISGNPLQGAGSALFTLRSYKYLKVLSIDNVFRPCIWSSVYQTHSDRNLMSLYKRNETITIQTDVSSPNENMNDIYNGSVPASYNDTVILIENPFLTFPIPKNLAYVELSRLIQSQSVDLNIIAINADNIDHIDITDNGLHNFVGTIKGLTSLKTLAMSGNNMAVLAPHFFDGFSGLENLVVSKTGLNCEFISSFSNRLFQNLRNLQRLDLSSNYLNTLSKGTFSQNSKLQWLGLSGNQFRDIPFDLQHTPNIVELDISSNAITTISAEIAKELDNLVTKNGKFHLSLGGNILSCGCNDLRFLQWLNITSVTFDQNRNYTCIDKDGEKAYTFLYYDLDSLWRKCWGQYFLYVAIILLCFYVIGFFLILLLLKNKNYIASYFLQLLGNFKLLTRKDYQFDVYIGYSDTDYRFPCFELREYIEDKLSLNTFLIDRDMLATLDKAVGIVEAINSSWRTVLVCSKSFLFDEWAMFTMRSAIYAQSPANPSKIVVLVHKNCLPLLPTELLSVVGDENVYVLSEWKVDYSMGEMLRTRLINE